MATRAQQAVIMQGMADKISRALGIAAFFQANSVRLNPENADTLITLTQAQKDALGTTFDGIVTSVKSDATTL